MIFDFEETIVLTEPRRVAHPLFLFFISGISGSPSRRAFRTGSQKKLTAGRFSGESNVNLCKINTYRDRSDLRFAISS